MRPAPADLKPFAAVYLSTIVVWAFDAALVSMMPQGLRLGGDIGWGLAIFAVLTAFGLAMIVRFGAIRIGIAALAYANVCGLKSISILAHLTPAYLGRGFPFVDASLQRWDEWLGFDWLAYFFWHADHPVFALICRASYLSWAEFGLLVVALLALERRTERLCRFVVCSSLSLAIVYLVAIITPSYGAYVQHGLQPEIHPGFSVQFSAFQPTFDALRAGVVDIYAAEVPQGAISFPSFHTTTVLLLAWAAWETSFRWPMLALQALSLLAIPVQGAHFVSDMVIGGGIGIVVILLSGPLVGWWPAAGRSAAVGAAAGGPALES